MLTSGTQACQHPASEWTGGLAGLPQKVLEIPMALLTQNCSSEPMNFLNSTSAKLTLKVPRNCAVLHLSKCWEATFSLVSGSTKRNTISKGTERRSVEVSVPQWFHFWNTDVNLPSWRSLPSCILLSRAHNKADHEMPVVGRAFYISVSLAPGRLCVYHVMVGVRNQGIHPALFSPLLHKFPTYPST